MGCTKLLSLIGGIVQVGRVANVSLDQKKNNIIYCYLDAQNMNESCYHIFNSS